MVKEFSVLVIPCYNEAIRLNKEIFLNFTKANTRISLLFVNDGSTDSTLDLLQEFSLASTNIEFISLRKNQGKAEAIRFGFLHALKKNPKFIGYFDADLATPLDAVFDFFEIFSQNPKLELVIGARVKLLGRHIDRKYSRHYLGRVFATFVSMTLNLGIYDSQCGAKLFKVHSHLLEIFQEPFHSRWIFDVEILARISRRSVLEDVVYEYPLKVWEDVRDSKVKMRDFFIAGFELGFIYLRYFMRKKKILPL